jgi:hypothetical protein
MNLREIGRGIVWFAIGAAVIAVAFFLLHRESTPVTQSLAVRSYPVAPEIAGEMRSALADAMGPHGSVSLSTDGRLLVMAPESLQRGVHDILQEVATKKPAATPAIHFELWAVSAVPGTAARPDDGPGLSEIAPVLGELQKARETLHFALLEKLALQARAGDNDNLIQGVRAGFKISPTVRYDAKGDPVIVARIDVQQVLNGVFGGQPGSLRAVVQLRPGQMLVIGQNSLPSSLAGAQTPQSQLYYIVRASL